MDSADRLVLAQEWHAQGGPVAGANGVCLAHGKLRPGGGKVVDVDGLSVQDGAARNPSPAYRSTRELHRPVDRSEMHRAVERFRQPVLVETFLPGRELTVGIVGTGVRARVLGVMEVEFTADAEPYGYSYLNKKQVNARYRIVNDGAAEEAARIALRAWNGLGC